MSAPLVANVELAGWAAEGAGLRCSPSIPLSFFEVALLKTRTRNQVALQVKDLCKRHELLWVACALLTMWEWIEAGGGKGFVTLFDVSCWLCHRTGPAVHPLRFCSFSLLPPCGLLTAQTFNSDGN